MPVTMIKSRRSSAPSETDIRESADAVAGLAMVRARLARCTQAEQDAFWKAVRHCFASAAGPEVGAA